MANQQNGTLEQRRLPPYPVLRRLSYIARSCSRLCEVGRQFLVAELYPISNVVRPQGRPPPVISSKPAMPVSAFSSTTVAKCAVQLVFPGAVDGAIMV